MVEKIEELKKELDEKALYGTDWRPQEGEEIYGRVLKVAERQKIDPKTGEVILDENGRPIVRRFLVVDVIEGKEKGLKNIWESKGLEGLFKTVHKGSLIGIKYLGKKALKGGRSFNRFEYVVK
jgi:hypothetical protein